MRNKLQDELCRFESRPSRTYVSPQQTIDVISFGYDQHKYWNRKLTGRALKESKIMSLYNKFESKQINHIIKVHKVVPIATVRHRQEFPHSNIHRFNQIVFISKSSTDESCVNRTLGMFSALHGQNSEIVHLPSNVG